MRDAVGDAAATGPGTSEHEGDDVSQGWQAPGGTPEEQGGPPAPSSPPPPSPPPQGPPAGGWGAPPPGAPDLTKPGTSSQPYAPPPGSQPYGSQPYGAQPYGYGYGPSMPPPAPLAPRPGVIPLRPLSLGEIYDGAFQAMRRNPGPMIGSAAVVGAFIAVATALFQLLSGPSIAGLLDPTATTPPSEDELIGAASAFLGGGLVTALVTGAGIAVLSGVLVLPVSRAVTGQSTTFGEVWKATWPRFWALVGLVLLAFVIGLGIYLATILVPVLLGAAVHPAFFALFAVTLPVLVLALLWLMVRSAIALPALMLERTGPLASWQRVRTLVGGLWTGPFWRTLGILLLAAIIVGVAQGILTVPAFLVSGAIAAANPDDPLAAAGYSPAQVLVSAVASIVASAVVYPFQAGVGTLLYVDHRMRREGLDVELARAASQ